MLEWIFPHDLFQGERVQPRVAEPGILLDLDTVFEDVVHSAAQPAFFIGRQKQVIAFAPGGGIAGLVNRSPDPDIVIVIRVGMPKDEVYVIAIDGIVGSDVEVYSRAEVAFPLLAGGG